MKRTILFFLVILYFSAFTQNLEDAYKLHDTPTPSHWPNSVINDWNGEYQIFLDKFYWNNRDDIGNPLESAAVSFSIEVVSFPFIPDGFDPDQNNNFSSSEVRNLNTDIVTDGFYYGNLFSNNSPHENYKGWGWQFGDYRVFQKLYNINTCDFKPGYYMCEGDYGLISQVYANLLFANYYDQCHLPHTVLKHTLYFHCGTSIDDDIIDSISWVYDNTRGAMREYPFYNPTMKYPEMNTKTIDVAFRPTFPDVLVWNYNPPNLNNLFFYDSGLEESTGSVDYFPPNEIIPYYWSACSTSYPLYYDPNPGPPYYTMQTDYYNNSFLSELVHPPSYTLLDAPLLNAEAGEYAGYDVSGNKMKGLQHKYFINEAFDLRIINPSEKIIYNPSEVTIHCDLTFPCYYKFLTLHGKYPDKDLEVHHGGDYSSEYWDANLYFDFDYDRDYPVPVNCTTNAECMSYYILDGRRTITIEPKVIIMDAHFSGTSHSYKGIIVYDPDYTFGNWTYDEETIKLVEIDWDDNIVLAHCLETHESGGGKSAPVSNEPLICENEIKVLNGSTSNPQIEINIDQPKDTHISIYNSFGSLVVSTLPTRSMSIPKDF